MFLIQLSVSDQKEQVGPESRASFHYHFQFPHQNGLWKVGRPSIPYPHKGIELVGLVTKAKFQVEWFLRIIGSTVQLAFGVISSTPAAS
jgi:hypothetical protein